MTNSSTSERRRGLRIAVAAVAVAGAAVATVGGVATAANGHKHHAVKHHHAAHAIAGAKSDSTGGLAGKVAAALDGKGSVTAERNWLPWGDNSVAGFPTLSDGANGYGGEVKLDGKIVQVLVLPQIGGPCDRADEDGVSCTASQGGHLISADGAVSFIKDGIDVEAVSDSLSTAELTALATDSSFSTAPFN
jgi:hypothetical protein